MFRELGAGSALLVALSAATLAFGCKGKASSSGGNGGDGVGGGATATTGTQIDLEPICKAYCQRFQPCAPQTDCKLGCMSSAVLACKKEYSDDVQCITENLTNCGGYDVPCSDAQAAYQACVDLHPPT